MNQTDRSRWQGPLVLVLLGLLVGGPLRAESPADAAASGVTAPVQADPAGQTDANSAATQPPTATTPTTSPATAANHPATKGLTQDGISELIAATQQAEGIGEEIKAEVVKRYQAAHEWLAKAEEATKRAAQYEAEAQQAPQLVEQAKAELASAQETTSAEAPADATLPQLEQLLAQAQSRLGEAQERLSQRDDRVKRRSDRKGELAKLTEETKQRLEETQKQLASPPPSAEIAELTLARRTELEARVAALRGQLTLLKAEAKRLDLLSELFPLNRDLAKREKNLCEKEVENLQQIVSQRRAVESERQAREAREAQRQFEMAHPVLRDLAEHNAALAEKRQLISDQITQVSREVGQIEKRLNGLHADFLVAEDKVKKAGHSTTVGLMLRRKREQLPQLHGCESRIRFVEREMPLVNLDRLELEEKRGGLSDIDTAAATVLDSLGPQSETAEAIDLAQTVRELLIAQRGLMDKLVKDLDTYLQDLSELEVSNRRLIKETQQFAGFIDEHVLWIRSADALQVQDVVLALRAVWSLAHVDPWMKLVTDSGLDALRHPLIAMGVLICAALLITFHARLRRRINDLCESRSSSAGTRFGPTIEAVLLSAVVAAEWPLLAFYFGWQMRMADQASDLGLALGLTLQYVAVLFWLCELLRTLCRSEGVAEIFFGWSPYGLSMVRRELWWLTLLGIPLAALVVFAQLYNQGEWANNLGRLAFLTMMLLLTASAHFLLHPKENLLREAIARDSQGWLSRVRFVAYALSVTVPMLLAILAAIGYYYSAQQLALRLQTTLGVVLVIVLLHAVTSRWVLVRRRALALQQSRDRQQRAAEAIDSADRSPGFPTNPPLDDDSTDLSAIHGKLQVLLRHAVTVCILVSSWFIWSDVLPALRVLDRVVFWVKTVDVMETYQDVDGKTVRQRVPQSVPTTLRHGLIAAVLLLVTFTLGKNLPALLEITLLNQLPFDKGGRHAISVILRYGVALTGVLLACRTMSISWSSVQWLAAGITVGLGFGLQEIFANLVSGLILLFERPIRVGDIITLGDVTGSVTNIRIRATTVTDWDRKELIVPNKELVTGRLLNWTLSNTTNRIVIQVGVAYASNTDQARQILLETAREHPNVLKDPEPNVTFEGFGDSTLNFVVRAYLATLDVRLKTIHELHSQIFQRLREAKIEIAFPQRDINLRLQPSAVLPAPPPVSGTDRRSAAA